MLRMTKFRPGGGPNAGGSRYLCTCGTPSSESLMFGELA